MKCKCCGKDIRFGGMGCYYPEREARLCRECYKKLEKSEIDE